MVLLVVGITEVYELRISFGAIEINDTDIDSTRFPAYDYYRSVASAKNSVSVMHLLLNSNLGLE